MANALTTADWTKRAGQKVARTQLFIDGKFVDSASGKTFESINPRDGSVIAQVAEGDVEVGAAHSRKRRRASTSRNHELR